MQPHHLSCAFWADQLSNGKSDRKNNKNGGDITIPAAGDQHDQHGSYTDQHEAHHDQDGSSYHDQHGSLIAIAEAVLTHCLDQRNVSVGCLVAQFLFKNGGKRFDAETGTMCQITMCGYLNSLANNNRLALCQFLAQILPKFECSTTMPLHYNLLAILMKLLKANLHDLTVVQLINTKHLIHLWQHCFYVERGPSDLNKSIAKNLIKILCVVGPSPNELFKHFLVDVPYFFRHKYLLMQYLLSSCSMDELDETVLLQFLGQLTLCLGGRWCEAELADAFHALALRLLEIGKTELLVQEITKTLTSNNDAIRENAVRLWFPKLNTSQQLRQVLLNLLTIFRSKIKQQHYGSEGDYVAGYCSPLPYWYYDSHVDPSTEWSCQQINLWAILQLFYWTSKNKIATISDADQQQLDDDHLDIATNALIDHRTMEETKKIAADSLLAFVLVSMRNKLHTNKFEQLFHQLASNFEHLMQLENANLCASVNSLITNLLKCFDQQNGKLIKCLFNKLINKYSAQNLTNLCPNIANNLLMFIETVNCYYSPEDEQFKLDVQNFLINALVYEHDSNVRQRSAQMAFRIAKNCTNFKFKLITLFKEWAPKLKFGIVHLYRTMLSLQIDANEVLDLHFLENDDGLNILFTRTKFEVQNQLAAAPTECQQQIVQFLSHCFAVNEKLLQFGGSDCAAQCVTVSELHSLFEKCSTNKCENNDNDDDDEQLLFWSDTQKEKLSIYSNGIIQSCSAIRWILCNYTSQIGENNIENGLRSIWTVLLRSHHKGILEHCGSDFCSTIEYFLCANYHHSSLFIEIREEIVEKTLAILCHGGGQCRNIAFAKILVPIFASICPIQREMLVKRIITFDFDQDLAVQTKLHLHQLFVLKELLSTTKFDLVAPRTQIFQFIMQITQIAMKKAQTERWRLFSMAANAFAALLHSIFRHLPHIVPLHNFYAIERTFCQKLLYRLRNIRMDLAQKRRSDPSIALLLVPLQRIFVLANPPPDAAERNWPTPEVHQFIAELSSELCQLISLEPSFLLKKQMAQVIDNLRGTTTNEEKLRRNLMDKIT